MIEVLPRETVVAAEKGPSHAAGDDVEVPRLSRMRDLAEWVGHAASVAEDQPKRNRKIDRFQVRFPLEFDGCPKKSSAEVKDEYALIYASLDRVYIHGLTYSMYGFWLSVDKLTFINFKW